MKIRNLQTCAQLLFALFIIGVGFSSEANAQGMKSFNSRNLILCLYPRDFEGQRQRRVMGEKIPESLLKKKSIKDIKCRKKGAIKIDRNNVDILGLSDEELNAFNNIVNNYLNYGNTPGPKGDKGDRGDVGPQGPQGLKGDAGPQGVQGVKGDKGDRGDIGLTGPIGPQGPQGPKGDKGDRGDVGPQGPQGLKGDAGPQGIQGVKGDKGDQGDIGLTGPIGPQGQKGDQGDVGPAGPEGPRGPAGQDGFGSSGCAIVNGAASGGRHITVSATCPDPEDVVVTYAANSSGWQSSSSLYHFAQVGARLDNTSGGPLPNRVTVAFECIETDALTCQGRSGSASLQVMCCR